MTLLNGVTSAGAVAATGSCPPEHSSGLTSWTPSQACPSSAVHGYSVNPDNSMISARRPHPVGDGLTEPFDRTVPAFGWCQLPGLADGHLLNQSSKRVGTPVHGPVATGRGQPPTALKASATMAMPAPSSRPSTADRRAARQTASSPPVRRAGRPNLARLAWGRPCQPRPKSSGAAQTGTEANPASGGRQGEETSPGPTSNPSGAQLCVAVASRRGAPRAPGQARR